MGIMRYHPLVFHTAAPSNMYCTYFVRLVLLQTRNGVKHREVGLPGTGVCGYGSLRLACPRAWSWAFVGCLQHLLLADEFRDAKVIFSLGTHHKRPLPDLVTL